MRDITDGSGAVIDTIKYDGFGVITSETDSTKTGLVVWQGMMRDAATGWIIRGHAIMHL